MKKLLAVICVLTLLCSLAGCQSQAPQTDPTAESELPTESSAPKTEASEPTQPPSEENPTEATLTLSGLREGYYIFSGFTMDGEFFPPGDSISHIRFDANRSGYLYVDGLVTTISWNNTYLVDNGSTYRFTIEDDVLMIDYLTMVNHYTYFGDTLPEAHHFSVPPAGEYIVFTMESDYYENRAHVVPDPINGMLRLNEDGTCTFFIDGEAKNGIWDVAIQIQSSPLPYYYIDSSLSADGFPFLIVGYGVRTFGLAPVTHDPETNTYIWDFLLEQE